LNERKQQFEKKKNANELVKPMLMSYPDYGKSTEHYQAGIVGVFAEYPETVQQRLAHPISGIRGRCAFLPTIADVVKMADEFMESDVRKWKLERRYGGSITVEPVHIVFNPFPKLTIAFEDEPELLKTGFQALFNASRALAVSGKDAAANVLRSAGGHARI
jgi:hypothetical protein